MFISSSVIVGYAVRDERYVKFGNVNEELKAAAQLSRDKHKKLGGTMRATFK
jgi:hypothetical protein